MESKEEDERTERQRIKRLERQENGTTNFISNLLDCVLTHILSLLPTRDSVRTSILSSRWSPLWKLVPVLHLERLRYQDTLSNIWIHRNAAIPLRKFHLHWTSDCNTAYVTRCSKTPFCVAACCKSSISTYILILFLIHLWSCILVSSFLQH